MVLDYFPLNNIIEELGIDRKLARSILDRLLKYKQINKKDIKYVQSLDKLGRAYYAIYISTPCIYALTFKVKSPKGIKIQKEITHSLLQK